MLFKYFCILSCRKLIVSAEREFLYNQLLHQIARLLPLLQSRDGLWQMNTNRPPPTQETCTSIVNYILALGESKFQLLELSPHQALTAAYRVTSFVRMYTKRVKELGFTCVVVSRVDQLCNLTQLDTQYRSSIILY